MDFSFERGGGRVARLHVFLFIWPLLLEFWTSLRTSAIPVLGTDLLLNFWQFEPRHTSAFATCLRNFLSFMPLFRNCVVGCV